MNTYDVVIADLEARRAAYNRSIDQAIAGIRVAIQMDKEYVQVAEASPPGWTPEQVQCVAGLIADRLVD